MGANELTTVEHPELALARCPDRPFVPFDVVIRQPSFRAALNLAIQVSGLEDKEIYLTLGIDPGQWSRIKAGTANFPFERYEEFAELVGNDVVIIWLASRRGYGLVLLQSEAEKRAEKAEARAKEAENQLQLLTRILQGRAA